MSVIAIVVAVLGSAVTGAVAALIGGILLRPKTDAETRHIIIEGQKTAADMWREWSEAQAREVEMMKHDKDDLMKQLQTCTLAARKAENEAHLCRIHVTRLEVEMRKAGLDIPVFPESLPLA